MTKSRALYYISFMLMLSALLMVLSNNVPILLSYRWLWAPIFLLFVLLFNNEILKTKAVIAVLSYGFFYVLVLQYSLWNHANDWYKHRIFEDFYAMIVFVILFAILHCGYFKLWSKLAKIGVLFITITGVMTIIATGINPNVVRASYSSGQLDIENYVFLHRLGFGSYGYMTAVTAFLPTLVYYFKQNKQIWLPRYVFILLLLFYFLVLFRAQIFANILVGTITIFFAFLGAGRLKKSLIYIAIGFVVVMLIPRDFYVNTLVEVSTLFDKESLLYEKFTDTAIYIQNPVIDEDDFSTGASGRASRYPALWKAFVDAPFLGDASYNSRYEHELGTGGHLYWMSRLSLWGIFGFLGYLVILKNIFKPVIKMFDEEFKFYYYLSLFSVVALGILKNLSGREYYIMLLIIIPGLYLIKKGGGVNYLKN